MKKLYAACALLAFASGAQALPIHYFGEITASGEYAGSVTSPDFWSNPGFAPNQFGEQQLNLWGLEANSGQTLSVDVNGSSGFNGGLSLYYGEVTNNDLLFGLFDNSGDIGTADYITGTTPFGLDTFLQDISLANSGFYTLIVGGKGPLTFDDSYQYTLDVKFSSVPEANSLLLLGTGLLGVVAMGRRERKRDGRQLEA